MESKFYAVEQTASLGASIGIAEAGFPVQNSMFVWVETEDPCALNTPSAHKWLIMRGDDEIAQKLIQRGFKKGLRWYPAPTAEELADILIRDLTEFKKYLFDKSMKINCNRKD